MYAHKRDKHSKSTHRCSLFHNQMATLKSEEDITKQALWSILSRANR